MYYVATTTNQECHHCQMISSKNCQSDHFKFHGYQPVYVWSDIVHGCLGDLHGNLDYLLIIFHKNGLPDNDNPYIFNGDFVDRGSYSVEVALILFSLLLLYPSAIFINRGNHEDYIMNIRYGFVDEVTMKYPDNGHTIISLFNEVFRWLPVACLIDGKVLVVHGGISPSTDLKHLNTINRNKLCLECYTLFKLF
ncbi:serine/threonine-protein phosphatase with EF-hands 1-like isoform X4 [Dysidea avara]|uniref:serine/threonine-protein phosphatase with EF-hands 1-like isoform X4 n=1 Tax=Dysidea avara TaxID=196820 RepID=UPI0033328738